MKKIKKRRLKKPFRMVIYLSLILLSSLCIYKEYKLLNNDISFKKDTLHIEDSKTEIYQNQDQLLTLSDYRNINNKVALRLLFDNDQSYNIPVFIAYNSDDSLYWMNHNIYNQQDSLGSAFLDELSSIKNNNIIINGHSSYSDERMFTFIKNYKDDSYLDKYPYIKLENDLGIFKYQVIFLGYYNENDYSDIPYVWAKESISNNDLQKMIIDEKEHILQFRDINSELQQYITLITCDMKNKEYRYVLLAQRIKGE